MTKPTTIRVSSNEICSTFERWLTDGAAETRLVILEGLTGSGKTTLTERPFALGTRHSVNIELDNFLRRPVSENTPYVDAIDRAALDAAIDDAVGRSPIVIVQGAIGWPLVQPVAATLGKDCIRRVYLKRMWTLRPDFWADEEFILDPEWWPPTDFHRSVYRYHAEQQPWLAADLVLERIDAGSME